MARMPESPERPGRKKAQEAQKEESSSDLGEHYLHNLCAFCASLRLIRRASSIRLRPPARPGYSCGSHLDCVATVSYGE
jgi:hypothetical protein